MYPPPPSPSCMVMQIIISQLKHNSNLFLFLDLILLDTYTQNVSGPHHSNSSLQNITHWAFKRGCRGWVVTNNETDVGKHNWLDETRSGFQHKRPPQRSRWWWRWEKKKNPKETLCTACWLHKRGWVHGGKWILYRIGVTTDLFPTSQHINVPAEVSSSLPHGGPATLAGADGTSREATALKMSPEGQSVSRLTCWLRITFTWNMSGQ